MDCGEPPDYERPEVSHAAAHPRRPNGKTRTPSFRGRSSPPTVAGGERKLPRQLGAAKSTDRDRADWATRSLGLLAAMIIGRDRASRSQPLGWAAGATAASSPTPSSPGTIVSRPPPAAPARPSLSRSMAWTSTSCSTTKRSGRLEVGLDPWIRISYPFLHADQISTPTLSWRRADFNCRWWAAADV